MKEFFRDFRFLLGLPRGIRRRVVGLRRGDVVVDLGANVGDVSRLFSRFGAKVYSFEPDPVAFDSLRTVAQKWNRISALPFAAGNENGEVNLFFHRDRANDPVAYSSGSSLMKNKPNVGDISVQVTQIDLAKFLKSIGPVQVLKVDVEGFEVSLVPQLIFEEALDAVENVFVETHAKKWPGLEVQTTEMIDLVQKSGLAEKFDFDWP